MRKSGVSIRDLFEYRPPCTQCKPDECWPQRTPSGDGSNEDERAGSGSSDGNAVGSDGGEAEGAGGSNGSGGDGGDSDSSSSGSSSSGSGSAHTDLHASDPHHHVSLAADFLYPRRPAPLPESASSRGCAPSRDSMSPPRWAHALEAIDQIDYSPGREFELNAQLRQSGFSASTCAEILTQAQLRAQAQEKFGELAAAMLFTRAGLEQATRRSIARQHAVHFAAHGVHHVLDYGCGIGADSLAFAQAGLRVSAIEIDEDTALAAAYNMRSFPQVQVINADASAIIAARSEIIAAGNAEFTPHSTVLATTPTLAAAPITSAASALATTPTIPAADARAIPPIEANAPTAAALASMPAIPAIALHWDASNERFQLQPLANLALGCLHLGCFHADALWLDPARRAHGRRLINPAHWQPPLSTAIALAERFTAAGIKVAPGIDYHHLPPQAFVQWISQRRELAEAVLWLGAAAPTPGRQAVLMTPHSDGPLTFPAFPSHLRNAKINNHAAENATGRDEDALSCRPNEPAQSIDPGDLGKYIIDPDPAIIRAGALAVFAKQQNFHTVSPNIAYLTGDHPAPREFGQSFTVLATFPLDPKRIGRQLRARGVTAVEIKKRGVDISPETFRKQLKLAGSVATRRGDAQAESGTPDLANPNVTNPDSAHWPRAATLILTPLLGKRQAILAVPTTSLAQTSSTAATEL